MSARTELSEGEVRAALAAFESGWLTMGPRIQALEHAFAARFGVAHAVAVGSGTAALHLAALAAGAKPGASVVVSALAGAEAVNAPRYAGARPRRADIADPAAPTMDVWATLDASDASTVAVIASHLNGFPVDALALRAASEERGWFLIEDATDALGAALPGGRPAGTAGHLGCFSFSTGRIVGVGEGGMVVTDEEALADRVRSLRSHAMTSVTWDRHRGHADSYDVVDIGFNARMDEPRAALAAARLERLDALVAERRSLAAEVAGVDPPPGAAPQRVVLTAVSPAERADLEASLSARGLPFCRWPESFAGLADPGAAPLAQAARANDVLIDLARLT